MDHSVWLLLLRSHHTFPGDSLHWVVSMWAWLFNGFSSRCVPLSQLQQKMLQLLDQVSLWCSQTLCKFWPHPLPQHGVDLLPSSQ